MAGGKLQVFIKALTPNERKEIEKVLSEGFLPPRPDLFELFHTISNFKGDYLAEGKGYKESDLMKWLMRYFSYKSLDDDESLRQLSFAGTLKNKSTGKTFSYAMKKATQPGFRNATYHERMFKAEELRNTQLILEEGRDQLPAYSFLMHHLDAFYISRKLQLYCEILNFRNVMNADFPLYLLKEIDELAQNDTFKELPAIRAYYLVLQTLTGNDESWFHQLKDYLSHHRDDFPPEELNELYQYLKNYCVRKINSGVTGWPELLFAIYQQILNDDRILNLGNFSQWEFKNIVTVSLRVGETDWCKKFIARHAIYLDPAERSNAVKYNTAYLHFMTHEYKSAIRLLRDVEFTDIFYKVDARIILLKSFFELEEMDSFYYQAAAFRLFLLRDKQISDYQKKINRNLVRYLEKLARNIYSRAKLVKLKDEILKERNIADIPWLISQINHAIENL